MTIDRRGALATLGATLGGAFAGCLARDPGPGDGDGDGDGNGNGTAARPIHLRVRNADAEARSVAVMVRDGGGTTTFDGSLDVSAGSTTLVRAVASSDVGLALTAGQGDDETSAAYDAGEVGIVGAAAYVDVVVEDGAITIEADAEEGSRPRLEAPEDRIETPDCGPDGRRDPTWLCAHLSRYPSVSFEQTTSTGPLLADEGLQFGEEVAPLQLYATLLTDADDLERLHPDAGGPAVDLLRRLDPGSQVGLLVQTGWGSGSVTPHLTRIGPADGGFHAAGCYRRPCAGTDDITVRTLAARFERPDEPAQGRVSLVVDPSTVVTVGVDEGVVSVVEPD